VRSESRTPSLPYPGSKASLPGALHRLQGSLHLPLHLPFQRRALAPPPRKAWKGASAEGRAASLFCHHRSATVTSEQGAQLPGARKGSFQCGFIHSDWPPPWGPGAS